MDGIVYPVKNYFYFFYIFLLLLFEVSFMKKILPINKLDRVSRIQMLVTGLAFILFMILILLFILFNSHIKNNNIYMLCILITFLVWLYSFIRNYNRDKYFEKKYNKK